MNPFEKLGLPSEVKEALGILDELATRFDPEAFRLVRAQVERGFRRYPREFVSMVGQGTPVRQIVLQAVSNMAGDLAESGDYHIYRGVLDPMGPGEELVKIYDSTTQELVRMGVVDPAYAETQGQGLRRNIASVG